MRPHRRSFPGPSAALLAALAMLIALLVSACAGMAGYAGAASPSTDLATAAASLPDSDPAGSDPVAHPVPAEWDGGTVELSGLPPEALATIELISAGGPHPYPQDGATFHNREGILPGRAEGFYREFTVETPGSPDRGARRLVIGEDGAIYYTTDHYDSFRLVIP
jgi:ribonuclease T1